MIKLDLKKETDAYGEYRTYTNILNKEVISLEKDDVLSEDIVKYFTFIPGKKLSLKEIDSHAKMVIKKTDTIKRLQCIQIHDTVICGELATNSPKKEKAEENEVVFYIDHKRYLINKQSILKITEIQKIEDNILIEIAIRKLSGYSLYHTEYYVFELNLNSYTKFIQEVQLEKW